MTKVLRQLSKHHIKQSHCIMMYDNYFQTKHIIFTINVQINTRRLSYHVDLYVDNDALCFTSEVWILCTIFTRSCEILRWNMYEDLYHYTEITLWIKKFVSSFCIFLICFCQISWGKWIFKSMWWNSWISVFFFRIKQINTEVCLVIKG